VEVRSIHLHSNPIPLILSNKQIRWQCDEWNCLKDPKLKKKITIGTDHVLDYLEKKMILNQDKCRWEDLMKINPPKIRITEEDKINEEFNSKWVDDIVTDELRTKAQKLREWIDTCGKNILDSYNSKNFSIFMAPTIESAKEKAQNIEKSVSILMTEGPQLISPIVKKKKLGILEVTLDETQEETEFAIYLKTLKFNLEKVKQIINELVALGTQSLCLRLIMSIVKLFKSALEVMQK